MQRTGLSGALRIDIVMSDPISLKMRQKLEVPPGWALRLWGVRKTRVTLTARLSRGADFGIATPEWIEMITLKLTLMADKNSAT